MRLRSRVPLLVLVCALEFIDLSLLSAIAPLLPRYAERFHFAVSGSGRVVAAFAVGNLLAALPAAMLCGRFGAKRITVIGLLLTAAGSVWLGLAGSEVQLLAARFVQGIASATAWIAGVAWLAAATPAERRGRTFGIAAAFAMVGTVAGPGLGALAAQFGIATVFIAFSGVALALAVLAATFPGTPPSRQPLRALVTALRTPPIMLAFWLIFLAGAFLAGQGSIGPLRLDELGWGAAGIGVVYMVGAALEAAASPLLGHWLDRARRTTPVAWALTAATVLASVLALPWIERHWTYAVVIAVSTTSFGLFFLPALTSLADGADAIGLDHAFAFSLASLAWGPGQVAGSLVGGVLAERAGDSAAFGLFAGATLLTLVALPRLPLGTVAIARGS